MNHNTANYIVEDDFDFFKELNDIATCDLSGNKCMISHLPLTYNSIILQCNHSFNYIPLYKELCIKNSSSSKRITCPYCRTTNNKLIPFIPLPNVHKRFGVNHPSKRCMPGLKCSMILKSGARKGAMCENNGMETSNGILCEKHSHHNNNADVLTPEIKELMKTKTISELKQMLKDKGLKISGVKKVLVKRLLQV